MLYVLISSKKSRSAGEIAVNSSCNYSSFHVSLCFGVHAFEARKADSAFP